MSACAETFLDFSYPNPVNKSNSISLNKSVEIANIKNQSAVKPCVECLVAVAAQRSCCSGPLAAAKGIRVGLVLSLLDY